MTARVFVGPWLCCAIVLATSAAAAEQGQVVLVGGQVLDGEIQKVVTGEYVVVRLANGDVKAIAWADIQSFTSGGGGSTAGTPKPPVYQPTAPPPVFVYAPAPMYRPPPPPPPPPPRRFRPAWVLGARVGTMAVGGNVYGHDHDWYHDHHTTGPELHMRDVASWGWMFEGDVGYHFSPAWTFYGFWEHGELARGDLNAAGRWGHTNAVGVGVNANTTPQGPVGFYVDVGAAYRWMEFSDATMDPSLTVTTRTLAEGFDWLRVGVGVSLRLGRRFRLDPHVYTSVGEFTHFSGRTCVGGGVCTFDSQAYDYGTHTFWGFALSGRTDL